MDGAKLFLDKITYFDGSNKKEALNFLAQCEEAAEKMKTSETTVAWSKLTGRADVVMREEIGGNFSGFLKFQICYDFYNFK